MWWMAGLAGALSVATGLLPLGRAQEVAVDRGAPVLGFLVAVTVLAELADAAGVFTAAAGVCARWGRGSTLRLFLLVAALGTVTTVGMSLDTTAVLLTPVVLDLTSRLGLRPLPFALLAVWLANAASLLLPVSNLTNLLAQQHLHASTAAFAGRMALPEVVSVLATTAYLGLLFRRDLRTTYEVPAPVAPRDRVAFAVCAAGCGVLGAGVLAGAPAWAAAAPGALAAVLVTAVRSRDRLRWGLVPWRLLVLTEGLFLAVGALSAHGLTRVLSALVAGSPLRSVLVAAAASNGLTNLPAYLALEAAVHHGRTTQLLAVLLGTDAGPLVLVFGSLATLLWRERCAARGVHVPARTFAAVGLGGVPVLLLGTWAALLVTG